MNFLMFILCMFSLIFFIVLLYYIKQNIVKNKKLQEKNQELLEQQLDLQQAVTLASSKLDQKTQQLLEMNKQISESRSTIDELHNNLNESISKMGQSFDEYAKTLELSYQQVESEYDNQKLSLEDNYNTYQNKLLQDINTQEKKLQNIKNTTAAVIQANLKAKEIEDNIKFYCLTIKENEKHDIITLEKVKDQLSNPRILSMLIWQTFFRDKATELCNNVVGLPTRCGIYKITNQITKECYIGQSVDISKRFKDHMKCGLDIDRPQGNKLYQAMLDDGLWNFSFEVLEDCAKDQLNQKEKTFIDIYQSQAYGYNSTIGNK